MAEHIPDINDHEDAEYWRLRCVDVYSWNCNVPQIALDLIRNYGICDTSDPRWAAFDNGFSSAFGDMTNCENAIEVIGQTIEEFAPLIEASEECEKKVPACHMELLKALENILHQVSNSAYGIGTQPNPLNMFLIKRCREAIELARKEGIDA